MQAAKTIYFSDYPGGNSKKSGLTVPFSAEDEKLYEAVKPLSSHTIRKLIGFDTYSDVEAAANLAVTPVATFVRTILASRVKTENSADNRFLQIQSTFKGGKGSTLHDWYPYLEGYSPEFVENIIDTFADSARNILDPFGGTGTTPLVAAQKGGIGFYAEVNPVCQYVIATKALALELKEHERTLIARRLHSLSIEIHDQVSHLPEDLALLSSCEVLGTRPFFESHTLKHILKVRSLINSMMGVEPELAQFLTLSVLRALVPCSLLVRRGDLRFMTDAERKKGTPSFLDEVAYGLELIASDISDLCSAVGQTSFVTGNARDIQFHLKKKVDAVITSPPYLNGTNYFRNTKIELWFLGFLKAKSDLRGFRDAAITSGINDVTVGKLSSARHIKERFRSELLIKTLNNLNEVAYDSRIPAMVENYFYDMHDVLSSLPNMINDGGRLLIDLGDSAYCGVHVPTQGILAEILDSCGFNLEQTVVLRERQSRDGSKLNQTLQVFRSRKIDVKFASSGV